jgi:hypothetical protein
MSLFISILLVACFVLLLLQTFGIDAPRFRLGWGGLACAALVYLLLHWPK